MPFGKHKGKHLKDVPDDYLLWLYDNYQSWIQKKKKLNNTQRGLLAYIEDNLDSIDR